MAKPKAKKESVALSEVDKFFIRGNFQTWSPEQLAAELGKPVDLINQEISSIIQSQRTDLDDALERPARGVVCLTEAASSRADDLKGSAGIITDAHIQKAVEAGDYALAARLKESKDKQQKNAHLTECAKHADSWHFITPPEVHHERMSGRR